MILINPTVKYGSTYYNTFTMRVCNNYYGYFFQCIVKFWNYWNYYESKKKSTFFRKIFFSRSEELTFGEENVIFQNIFSNFNLFDWILVNFL